LLSPHGGGITPFISFASAGLEGTVPAIALVSDRATVANRQGSIFLFTKRVTRLVFIMGHKVVHLMVFTSVFARLLTFGQYLLTACVRMGYAIGNEHRSLNGDCSSQR
jgi:hypothetical protein